MSLVPEVQGRGLAKPMLGAVLRRLLDLHSTAGDVEGSSSESSALIVLKTHTQAARAIGMYLEAGFVPAPLAGGDAIESYTEEEGDGWKFLSTMQLPVEIPGTELQ